MVRRRRQEPPPVVKAPTPVQMPKINTPPIVYHSSHFSGISGVDILNHQLCYHSAIKVREGLPMLKLETNRARKRLVKERARKKRILRMYFELLKLITFNIPPSLFEYPDLRSSGIVKCIDFRRATDISRQLTLMKRMLDVKYFTKEYRTVTAQLHSKFAYFWQQMDLQVVVAMNIFNAIFYQLLNSDRFALGRFHVDLNRSHIYKCPEEKDQAGQIFLVKLRCSITPLENILGFVVMYFESLLNMRDGYYDSSLDQLFAARRHCCERFLDLEMKQYETVDHTLDQALEPLIARYIKVSKYVHYLATMIHAHDSRRLINLSGTEIMARQKTVEQSKKAVVALNGQVDTLINENRNIHIRNLRYSVFERDDILKKHVVASKKYMSNQRKIKRLNIEVDVTRDVVRRRIDRVRASLRGVLLKSSRFRKRLCLRVNGISNDFEYKHKAMIAALEEHVDLCRQFREGKALDNHRTSDIRNQWILHHDFARHTLEKTVRLNTFSESDVRPMMDKVRRDVNESRYFSHHSFVIPFAYPPRLLPPYPGSANEPSARQLRAQTSMHPSHARTTSSQHNTPSHHGRREDNVKRFRPSEARDDTAARPPQHSSSSGEMRPDHRRPTERDFRTSIPPSTRPSTSLYVRDDRKNDRRRSRSPRGRTETNDREKLRKSDRERSPRYNSERYRREGTVRRSTREYESSNRDRRGDRRFRPEEEEKRDQNSRRSRMPSPEDRQRRRKRADERNDSRTSAELDRHGKDRKRDDRDVKDYSDSRSRSKRRTPLGEDDLDRKESEKGIRRDNDIKKSSSKNSLASISMTEVFDLSPVLDQGQSGCIAVTSGPEISLHPELEPVNVSSDMEPFSTSSETTLEGQKFPTLMLSEITCCSNNRERSTFLKMYTDEQLSALKNTVLPVTLFEPITLPDAIANGALQSWMANNGFEIPTTNDAWYKYYRTFQTKYHLAFCRNNLAKILSKVAYQDLLNPHVFPAEIVRQVQHNMASGKSIVPHLIKSRKFELQMTKAKYSSAIGVLSLLMGSTDSMGKIYDLEIIELKNISEQSRFENGYKFNGDHQKFLRQWLENFEDIKAGAEAVEKKSFDLVQTIKRWNNSVASRISASKNRCALLTELTAKRHAKNEKKRKLLEELRQKYKQLGDEYIRVSIKNNDTENDINRAKREHNTSVNNLKRTSVASDDKEAELMYKHYKEKLFCPTCKVRIKNCALTRCYHLFCDECITQLFKTRNRKCPECNARIGPNDFRKVFI